MWPEKIKERKKKRETENFKTSFANGVPSEIN